MRALLMHFDAPLQAYGGVLVDSIGKTDPVPGASLLTGLFGNALGWNHGDAPRLQALQERLDFAVRVDQAGELMTDYQTVDLGQTHLVDTGWTTWGRREDRRGGVASIGTHIRSRQFWAGRVLTLAVGLHGDGPPDLDTLGAALRRPARPLFIGRKPCIPGRPIYRGYSEGENLAQIVLHAPFPEQVKRPERVEVWNRANEPRTDGSTLRFTDQRDWSSQFHTGSRYLARTLVDLPAGGNHA
jgi:CRISPR system Cascade subunit CasD